MRTVMFLLLGGLLLGPVACRPKLTTLESRLDTAAEIEPLKKLLVGRWELLGGDRQHQLPWLNKRADYEKGRTLEFMAAHPMLRYQRSGEGVLETGYRFVTKDTIEIDLGRLLGNDKPEIPTDKMLVRVNVTPDQQKRDVLTLTMLTPKLENDPLHRVDRYRRMP